MRKKLTKGKVFHQSLNLLSIPYTLASSRAFNISFFVWRAYLGLFSEWVPFKGFTRA